MKKINLILIISLVLFACKNETKTEVNLEENRAKSYDQNDGLIAIKGDFVYDKKQNAAVLQTETEIYGVVIDDNMHLLNEKVTPLKIDEFTSIPVTVRVKRIENTNPDILWEQVLEIKEILKVEAPNPNKEDVIKLGN
ncbi:hypothetical protein [uncultured Winogradskyella sp.]|uniref:hypothetical protein n=1 Tax=uncultured Winogradskyella sp. TaxID=395353 RepID=UPI00261FBBEF|nr:hypothetical protein [uncultured Winogradskyella sp.]